MIFRREPGELGEIFAGFFGGWELFAGFFIRRVFSAGDSRPKIFDIFRWVCKEFPLPGAHLGKILITLKPFELTQIRDKFKLSGWNFDLETQRKIFTQTRQKFTNRANGNLLSQTRRKGLGFPNPAKIYKPGEWKLDFSNPAKRIWSFPTRRKFTNRANGNLIFQTRRKNPDFPSNLANRI